MTGCKPPEGTSAPWAGIAPGTIPIPSTVELIMNGSWSEESGTIVVLPLVLSAVLAGPSIPAKVVTPDELLVQLPAPGW